MNKVNVLDIIRGTTVDGPGFRTAIYLAGCRHACPGCHNPQSWPFDGGTSMTIDEIMEIVKEEDFDVTLSGGDPLYHPEAVKEICRRVRDSGHTVWIYTGFTWEEILQDESLLSAAMTADVIVDSPYVEALRNPDLRFRGSSNQRFIVTSTGAELFL